MPIADSLAVASGLAALLLTASACGGDGGDCSAEPCVSGFELRMPAAKGGPGSSSDGRFASGLWTIVVEADGGVFEGTCDVSGADADCSGEWTTPSEGNDDAGLRYEHPFNQGNNDTAAFVFFTSEDVPPLPEASTVVTFGGEAVLEDEWLMPDAAPEEGACGSCVPRVVRSATIDL